MACIFLIEDDCALAALLIEVLEDDGHQVLLVTTGNAALAQLAMVSPQLIIADMVLVDMLGISVCQAIQANPATVHIPIVICSALKEWVIQEQCTYAAFLAKPFDLTDLLRLVALHSLPLPLRSDGASV